MKRSYLLIAICVVAVCLFCLPSKSEAGGFGFGSQFVIQNGNHCGFGNQAVIVQRRGFFNSHRFNNQRIVIQNRNFRRQNVVFVPQSFGFQRQQNVFRIEIDD